MSGMQQAMPKMKQHVCSVQDAQVAEVAGSLMRCTADDVLHEVESCHLQRAGVMRQPVACGVRKSWPALLCNAALWWPLFLLKLWLHQHPQGLLRSSTHPLTKWLSCASVRSKVSMPRGLSCFLAKTLSSKSLVATHLL